MRKEKVPKAQINMKDVCPSLRSSGGVGSQWLTRRRLVEGQVYAGQYLEANVSIVCAVFLGVGSTFFVSTFAVRAGARVRRVAHAVLDPLRQCWLKVKTAPSAITFPCVFACIQMDGTSPVYQPLS